MTIDSIERLLVALEDFTAENADETGANAQAILWHVATCQMHISTIMENRR